MTEVVPSVSLAQEVEAAIRSGKVELPVLPEVAIRVRELIARESAVPEIAAVIEREPAFAAAMLRYANSVAYAGLREIKDLRQAVMRLGLAAAEQTILSIAARSAFESKDPRYEQLLRTIWKHSLVTAVAARRLASRAPGVGPELAFLGGLLHDIGKVVILRCAAELGKRDAARFRVSDTALLEFFDTLHCHVGDVLFDSWNLPHEIREVVRRHHDEKFQGEGDTLVAIVSFADHLAAKLGASLSPDPDRSLLDCPAATLLRLDDVKLASLLCDIEDDVLRLKEGL